ncbi:MAG: MlaD family protein [Bacteroidales bacterium]|nr:MlaD family protein [Bacteroidales bacterium]
MEKKSIIKIGIYVTIAFVVLVWGLSFLKGSNVFNKGTSLVAVYSRLEGLAEGSPVMISGYRIGSVRNIKFLDNGHQLNIIADMEVSNEFKIPRGSIAKIVSVDIMGTKGVEIFRPESYSDYHKSGDTIASGFDGGIMDMAMDLLMPMKTHLGSLLGAADSTMQQINGLLSDDNISNLSNSLNDLNKLSRSLSANTGNINSMLANFSNLSNALGKNSDNINRAIGNFASLSDTLSAMNLQQTLADAQTALNNVNQMLDAINNGNGTAHQILNNDTLYNNLQAATEKINYLLEDFEKHPKKYVNLAIFGGKEKPEKK